MKDPVSTHRLGKSRASARGLGSTRLLLGLAVLSMTAAACAPERPPNILLITLDTTRPDRLGPYGYPAAQTPNLDRFAEQAHVYDRAYATSSWTLASHASILTGLLPRQHGAQSVPKGPNRSLGYGVRPLADSFVTLAEVLADAGYRTGAVVAGPALRRELGTAQGFEIYEDELDSPLKKYNGKRAEETTDLALGLLEEFGNAPWFLFVNYFDAHAPYAPPVDFELQASEPSGGDTPTHAGSVSPRKGDATVEKPGQEGQEFNLVKRYIERLSRGAPPRPVQASPADEIAHLEELLSGYDAEIAYMDQHLGRLLEALDRESESSRTWVIITSDHGESFGEHYFVSHGAHLYEDNVRVPLIVRAPGAETGRRIAQTVQNHRLFGSILDMAGLPRPDWALPLHRDGEAGEAVLEVHRSDSNILIGGEFFDRDLFSVVVPPYKLIRSSKGRVELFDLSQDPHELKNLHSEKPDLSADLDRKLSSLQSSRPPLYSEPDKVELRKETIEALRAMGYIE